jgi:hypothetical protein
VGLAAVSAVALSGAAAVPEHWVPDADRTHCKGCSREFGVLTRRHHCRGCGEVMCHHCAPHRPAGERACKSCSAAAGPA